VTSFSSQSLHTVPPQGTPSTCNFLIAYPSLFVMASALS
jgi:hypothetical protein